MSATFLGIVVFTCVAVTLGTYMLLAGLMTVQEQADDAKEEDLFSDGLLFKLALPFIQYFGKAAGKMRMFDKTRRDLDLRLDFAAALNRIGEKLGKHPFRDELRLLNRDLAMGKTRAEALRDLEKRIGLEDLTTVVSALVQADELGASLGPTLRIQSAELQRRRFQRAEKKAMQAPVLMLIPLVIFIFPLVFLVIFGPMALRIFYGGGPSF